MSSPRSLVITGAAGNLGRAMVAALAPVYRLVLVDVSSEALGSVDAPDSALRMPVDLLDAAATAQAMQQASDQLGPLHGLVTTVGGFGGGAPLHEGPANDLARLLRLNVEATASIARAIAPQLIAAGGGRIVTIGSLASLGADPSFVAYSVAKTAVLRLTEGLAAELGPHGVSVNCLLPSTLDTPTNREAMPDTDPTSWVQPATVAEVAAFLLSEAGAAVQGSALRIP